MEALKSIVFQAPGLRYITPSENQMSFELEKYLDAHSADEYVNILAGLLHSLKLVYIIVNAKAMVMSTALDCRTSLQRLSRILSRRQSRTVPKIFTTSHGPERQKGGYIENLVLPIGSKGRQADREKAKNRIRRLKGKNLTQISPSESHA